MATATTAGKVNPAATLAAICERAQAQLDEAHQVVLNLETAGLELASVGAGWRHDQALLAEALRNARQAEAYAAQRAATAILNAGSYR